MSQMTLAVQIHAARGKRTLDERTGKVSNIQSVNGKRITVDAIRPPAAVTFAESEGTIAGAPFMTDNAVI